LHERGSSAKIIISNKKNNFREKYLNKDLLNIIIYLFFFRFVFLTPWILGDPENFTHANYISPPTHIKPE
jgi:quinol-cytochrome oxidoreductase complex cytochrome b subunit